jgi:hypothetical protein
VCQPQRSGLANRPGTQFSQPSIRSILGNPNDVHDRESQDQDSNVDLRVQGPVFSALIPPTPEKCNEAARLASRGSSPRPGTDGTLGYEEYVIAAGNWGAHIGARMAYAHPDAVLGLHLNMLPLRRDPGWPEHPSEE